MISMATEEPEARWRQSVSGVTSTKSTMPDRYNSGGNSAI
jgi:hypothetical protein